MRPGETLRFAAETVLGSPVRAVLMAVAFAIGVTGVLVLTWIGNGARVFVLGELQSLGTNLLFVLPGRAETTGTAPPLLGETPRDLTIADAYALLKSPAIARVAPIVAGNASVAWQRREREAMVIGSTHEFFTARGLAFATGRTFVTTDPEVASSVCVLGSKLKDEIFGSASALGEFVRIGERRYRVVGSLSSSGRSLGLDLHEMAVIPVAAAQALFDTPALFRILVEAKSEAKLAAAERDVVAILKERHDGEDDVTLITQKSILATLDRVLRALTLAVAGIAAISLVVAGLLIMNVMVLAVSQRRQEIGLLKALGAAPRDVRRLFLTEALVIATLGALLGMALGFATTWVVARFYPVLEGPIPWWALLAAVGVALSTGLAFGVMPARRAAALDPVLALQKR